MNLKVDAAIIGGGPVGLYTTYLLSKRGYGCILLEKKFNIGLPLKCAGLVNPRVFELEGLGQLRDSTFPQPIRGADVYSPSHGPLEIRGKSEKAVSIDRHLFERSLMELVHCESGDFRLGSILCSISEKTGGGWHLTARGMTGEIGIDPEMVIACDGASSLIRNIIGSEYPQDFLSGVSSEGVVKNACPESDIVGVFLGSKISKGLFGWVIPTQRDGYVKIGIASKGEGNIHERFRTLLSDAGLRDFLGIENKATMYIPVSYTVNPIPIGLPTIPDRSGMIFLGDSVGMPKATSGGGILPGLESAISLMRYLSELDEISDLRTEDFYLYWKKNEGKELVKSGYIRDMINSLTDVELDKYVKALSDPDLLELINEKGDIDRPVELAARLLRHRPSLITLVPRFIPKIMRIIR